jgi:NADH-quinone oxidoreductase subunit J
MESLMPSMPPTPEQAMFLGMAGLAALGAVGVVVMKNPVRAALCLILNFFVLAFIYFTLGASMLGITQIIVYTGAIMVLFLFVIMLLNLSAEQKLDRRFDFKPIVGVLFGLAMMGAVGSQVLKPLAEINTVRSDNAWGAPQSIGYTLFTNYAWPIEAVSILLVIGIVGSILLAKRRV